MNNNTLNVKYCNEYKVIPNRYSDKNSYVDGNGKLHRNVLPHTRSTITFNTGFVTDLDILQLSSIFDNRVVVDIEYWNPLKQDYYKGKFYVPDIELEALMTSRNIVTYRPINIELIEY